MFDLPKVKVSVRFRAPSASHAAETIRIEKIPFEIDSQGCRLRGFILRSVKEGRIPAVIVSHGFGSCTRDTKKYARVFVSEGYAAICFDFCMSGSGKSTGSSLGMSVLTEKTDLLNVLDYVKTLDYVDPDHAPEQFRALFVKLSSKYVLDVIGMDPFQEICGFQKPVLIVHGTKDRLVDISYSRRACESYRDCRLVEVRGDHGFILSGFAQSKRATIEYLRQAKS